MEFKGGCLWENEMHVMEVELVTYMLYIYRWWNELRVNQIYIYIYIYKGVEEYIDV